MSAKTQARRKVKYCPYCLGAGGHSRLVRSRFFGVGDAVHDGEWEACWACLGDGLLPDKEMLEKRRHE